MSFIATIATSLQREFTSGGLTAIDSCFPFFPRSRACLIGASAIELFEIPERTVKSGALKPMKGIKQSRRQFRY
jgi:hypothetical protein